MSGDDSHDTVLELLLDHLKNTLEKAPSVVPVVFACMYIWKQYTSTLYMFYHPKGYIS